MTFRLTVGPLLLALQAAAVPSLPAQSMLFGHVRQDSSGTPLAGVEVVLEGSAQRATTDAQGRFRLGNLPDGLQTALFRLVGYRPVRLRVRLLQGDSTRADAVMLKEAVQQLDPVEVAGKPNAPRGVGVETFEERRRLGFGRFIDSSELRRHELRRIADVLRGVPGLNLVRWRECSGRTCDPVEERAASGQGAITSIRGGLKEYCWMTVLLDGHYLYTAGSGNRPPDFSRDFRVAELQAIEIYRSSSEVPPEFGGAVGGCGVIVLWSRRH